MTISSTNYADFSYIAEVTAGTTPATPNFQRLPVTSVGLTDGLTTAVSEVIRSDRQTDDLVIVDSEVGGECNYELSYAPYKPLLTSLLQGGSGTTIAISAATDIVYSNTNSEITSTTTNFTSAGITAGMFFRTSGSDDPTNDGIYRVVSVTDANTLVVSPAPAVDDTNTSVDIDGTNIRNGAQAADSFTFRKQLNAPGGSNAIFYYRGCQISSMSFDFSTGSILNGAMNVMGRTSEGTATAITGETFTAVPAYDIMNSVSSIANIDITGLPATTEFSSFNLNIDNQINAAKAIGTLGAADLASFSLQVTADVEVYFEDTTVYNLYKNATAFSVAITLQDGSGNNLIVYLPKCKFEELSEPVDGKDNFLMESGSLRALRDTTTDMMVQFTFIDA
jgi:hypothetical protein